MWAFMFLAAAVLLALIFCVIYLSVRTAHFPLILHAAGDRRILAFLIALALYAAVGAVLYLSVNAVNAVICFVHLGGFWLLSELFFLILRKITHRNIESWIAGVCAILFTICYMLLAFYLCNHVREKDYAIESDRLKGDLRVVQFADSHVGSTFHADGLRAYVRKINELHPDLVAVTGDFVDDDTSREDLIGSCEALGELETTYGVFFCYGNHDKGYSRSQDRGWTPDELYENLVKNGVTVLQDEAVEFEGRFCVIGRKDRSEEARGGGRKTPELLMEELDPDLYKIVLDHQPCEYEKEAQAGADLVLSGHSHGGQFFPFNNIGVLTHQYDRSYGHEKRGRTDFIVTSGISDWTLLFKTGCASEYVVANIHGTA